MATYTVRYKSVCGGGEHFTFDVYRDGVKVALWNRTKTELLNTDYDWRDVLGFLVWQAIKAAGATTPAQAKAAIEAKEWVL